MFDLRKGKDVERAVRNAFAGQLPGNLRPQLRAAAQAVQAWDRSEEQEAKLVSHCSLHQASLS